MAINGFRGAGARTSASASRLDTIVPSRDAPRTYSIEGFRITTRKLPILRAGPIDEMTNRLGISPPEMIFGDNLVAIEYPAAGWSIKFDAFGALDRVDKTGEDRLKVAYSTEWQSSRENNHDVKEVVKPFDWSYTTDYRGEVPTDAPQFSETTQQIPLELLRRPDPILFFDDVILYESELDDNGISMVSVKIRVMPARLLLLSRLFMRLDNVLLRVRDTRVYVDFDKKEVIREYLAKEKDYEAVRLQLAARRDDVAAAMRDANMMAELLPVVEKQIESVSLMT